MTDTPRLLTPAAKLPPLDGQVVLVTGAASGLGRCIGAVLGEAGARVVLADLAAGKVQSWTNELTDRGIRAQALELDVGDAQAVERAIATIQERFGRLDVETVGDEQITGALLEQVGGGEEGGVLLGGRRGCQRPARGLRPPSQFGDGRG